MTARVALLRPVLVGTSPAGVEYWARYEGDVEAFQKALERHHARAAAKAAKPVRVKWTPAQRDRVMEGFSQESLDRFAEEGVVLRSTFVEGTKEQLADIAGMLDPEAEADMAGTGYASTEEQVVFSQRAAYASTLMLQRRLQGREITASKARRIASKRYF